MDSNCTKDEQEISGLVKQNDEEIGILDLFGSMILESIHEYIARCFAGVWYD